MFLYFFVSTHLFAVFLCNFSSALHVESRPGKSCGGGSFELCGGRIVGSNSCGQARSLAAQLPRRRQEEGGWSDGCMTAPPAEHEHLPEGSCPRQPSIKYHCLPVQEGKHAIKNTHAHIAYIRAFLTLFRAYAASFEVDLKKSKKMAMK